MDTTKVNEMNETSEPDFTRVLVVAVARAIRRWSARADEKADLVQECRDRIREYDEKRSKGRKSARQPSPTDEEVARLKEQLQAMQEAISKLTEGRSDDRLTEFIAAQATMQATHESRMDDMCQSQKRLESTVADLAQSIARLAEAQARPSGRDSRRRRARPPKKAPRRSTASKDAAESTTFADQSAPIDVSLPTSDATNDAMARSATGTDAPAEATLSPDAATVVAASTNFPEEIANPAAEPVSACVSTPPPTGATCEPEVVEAEVIDAGAAECISGPAVEVDGGDTDGPEDESWGSTASLTRAAEVHDLAPQAVVAEAWDEIHTALAASARGDHRAATKHWHRADELTERTSLENPDPEGRRSLGRVRLRRAVSMARVGDPRSVKVSSSAAFLALEVARATATPQHRGELDETVKEHEEIARLFGRDLEDDLLQEIRAFTEIERSPISGADDLLALMEATP